MYQKIQVIYRGVFMANGNKDSLSYHEEGLLHKHKNQYHLLFSANDHHFDISYDDQRVVLKNDDRILHLTLDRKVRNEYKSDYGYLHLDTKLLKLEGDEHHLHLIYELYDHGHVISKVYIKIQYLPYIPETQEGENDVREEI